MMNPTGAGTRASNAQRRARRETAWPVARPSYRCPDAMHAYIPAHPVTTAIVVLPCNETKARRSSRSAIGCPARLMYRHRRSRREI